MAAIVDIREFNGGSSGTPGTPTPKTSGTIRFKDADDANVDLINPIVRPGAGQVWSYEKILRLRIGATGPTGSITSPRAFSDFSNGFGTGVTMEAGVIGVAGYEAPVSTNSALATTDFFTFSSGSPLEMDTIETGPYSGTSIDIADFLYLQAEVASTASPGLTPTEVLTIAYDET
jgi:hypothetical protein